MATDKALTLLAQAQTLLDAVKAELAPAPAPAPQPTPAPKPAGRVPENPVGAVAGLRLDYYEGTWPKLPDFASLTPVSTSIISVMSLSSQRRGDNFGQRTTGFVYVPLDEERTFYTSSDDGSRLYIGNQLVVDNDGPHGMQERSGKILLQKGLHAITVDYYDSTGDQQLVVSWGSATQPKQVIPASAFFRVPAPTKQAPIAEAKPEPNTTAENFKAILR
jgi:hypothetical protein